MRIIFILSLVLYSLLNGHAYAQTADSSTQSRPSDANSYCQKLIGSADANKYASKYAEVIDKFRELNTVSGQRPRDPEIVKVINQVRQAYYLGMDDDSRSNAKGLIKLINKAVPREDSYNQDNFLIRYLPWLSGCASKLIDSPLRYIFFDPTIGREVLKSFKEADTARQSEILMEIWDAPSLGGLYDKRVQEKTGLPNIGINPHWVTPFLFAVDVPDLKPEAVQSIGRLDSIISQLNLKIQMVKLDVQRESAKKEAAEIAQRESPEIAQRESPEIAQREAPEKVQREAAEKVQLEASFEQYCNRFNNSPAVQALSKAMDSLAKETNSPAMVIGSKHSYLDNSNGDLEKWVAQKLALFPSRKAFCTLTQRDGKTIDPVILKSMADVINLCAKKTDAFLVGARFRESAFSGRVTDEIDDTFINTNDIRTCRPGTVAKELRNPREATLLAFFFDGAEEEIRRISPNPSASFIVAADSVRQQQKKEEQAKASKAAEEAAATKRRAEAAAYNASPEGQLLYSYQHFQIVKHCHDMRKGLAVQFVNANEMADYSSKMKQIEGKLKGALKAGSTDRLWEIAEKNNRKFGGALIDGVLVGSIDYFEVLTNNNKTNWMSAKGDCDIQSEAFRGMIKSVLGNAPVKKSF